MSATLAEYIDYEPHTPDQIIQSAIAEGHDRFYGMYSGGQDSTCTTHFVAENYPDNFVGVIHADTGVSLEATRKFVIEYCKEMEWPLFFTKPPKRKRNTEQHGTEFTYEAFVMQYGFPHAKSHPWMMAYLKKFGWENFMHNLRKKEPGATLISGVRKSESVARMKLKAYTQMEIHEDNQCVYVPPFLYKTGYQVSRYFFEHGLKKSPAYDMGFGISGECMCGAFADPWERELIRQNDPPLYARIVKLEKDVKAHGSEYASHHVEWGKSVPYVGPALAKIKKKPEQSTLFEEIDPVTQASMCGESCGLKLEVKEDDSG